MKQDNLAVPLRWDVAIQNNWHIENINNSQTWIRKSKHQNDSIYTQISVDFDSYGFPVVILKKPRFYAFIKLTENMAYIGKQLNNITKEFRIGGWTKKNPEKSKFLFSLKK